jgi:predicted  nucleic acid-binding Zn-ribbon protein
MREKNGIKRGIRRFPSATESEEFMGPRDTYVKKLKAQLDQWNADISKLEAKAKKPLAEAKETYETQLRGLRQRRDMLHQQMLAIQKASELAWDHLREGTDKAWKAMEESFRKVWSDFK